MICVLRKGTYNHPCYFLGNEMEPRKSQAHQHGEDADKVRSPHAADVDAH